MAPQPRAEGSFGDLIRGLMESQRLARRLQLKHASQLIDAAMIETALQWDGGPSILDHPTMRLETILRMKMRLALAAPETNVVPMHRD